jgi:tRNA (guanine37-N1)-methyltransferase
VRFIRVPRGEAENVRLRLLGDESLHRGYDVESDELWVYFPVKSVPADYEDMVCEREGRVKDRRPKSLRQALEPVLSEEELELAPASYTIVGDIAVLELDDRLMMRKWDIGGEFIRHFPHVRVVALKAGQVDGRYRVPSLEIIAGEERTETVHRENGIRLKVDIAGAYFNPRNGTERMRVVSKMREGERVLVLFAGVGPYAILAAKRRGASVTAVELNPVACEYMRENARLNKVGVDVVEGDAKIVTPALGLFDRIIMPLPKIAGEFSGTAVRALKPGGMIHLYCFARNEDEAKNRVLESVEKAVIVEVVECGGYSPCQNKYCIDYTVG